MLAGLSFLYGAGLIYVVMLTLALTGVHWSALNVTAICLVLALLAWGGHSYLPGQAFGGPDRNVWPTHFLDLATLYVLVSYTIYSTIARLWEWDFWAIWGFKARTFLEIGTIDWRFLESPFNDFTHPDYPLLYPLNYAYSALMSGGWSDRWLGFVGVAFSLALLLIVRHLAGEETRPIFAAAITFAVTFAALSKFIGLAEAPMIAFGGAGLLFLRRGLLFDNDASMRHAAILIGLAAATKNEGMALLVTAVIAVAIVRWRAVIRLWPAFAIAMPWAILKSLHHFTSDLTRGDFISRLFYRLGAIVPIGAMLVSNLAVRWVWLALLIAILFVPQRERSRERFVLIAFIVQIGFYIAIYCATANDVQWQIATSWPRLTFQVATPLVYVTMMMLARTYDSAHAEARSEQQ